jgi:nitrogen regulatory protein PII-like uncharacterized protein
MLKKEKYIISTIAFVAIAAFFFIFTQDRNFYSVENIIADSSDQGKAVFYFIKVKDLDKDFMINTAHHIRDNDSASFLSDKNQFRVMVAYFYRETDVEALPDSLADKIHRQKPSSKGREYRIDYVKNGYIYTDISRDLPDIKYPKDSLFASQLFIPKKGYSAKEIFNSNLRRNKSYLYGDSKNSTDTNKTIPNKRDTSNIPEIKNDNRSKK